MPLRERANAAVRARGRRFWATVIVICSVVVMFVGSQIAHDRGQSVDWYTGFGQWLGALASFIAAGTALWISTTDRRNAVADQRRIEKQQEDDLRRQAGLVKVTVEMLGKAQPVGPMIPTPSVGIRNRRIDRIFDIEVAKFVHHGEELELQLDRIHGYAFSPPRSKPSFAMGPVARLMLQSDEMLVLYQQGSLPGTPADFAAVRYTDSDGRRWEVDSDGGVSRL